MTARFRLLLVLAGMALSALLPSGARANGRFPEAQRLLEHPGNPNRLYMAATFGLLVTEDHGASWSAICEEAFALKFLEGDPLLEVLPDGALLGGIFDTLNRSSDCGCTWQTTLGAAEPETILDISIDRSTGAIVALMQDATTFPARMSVWESTDLGKTWRKLSDLPATLVNVFTIDVAPSDSSRIYVSGVPRIDPSAPLTGTLAVSSDHGATWQTRPIAGAGANALPFIAAVDPARADRLYVRTDAWEDSGDYSANDALLVSDDAGQTWREVARRAAKLFGFALSPDGGTVLIGYGDPVDAGGRTVNPDEFGIYKASTATFGFEKIFTAAIGCLRWTATGLYACIIENHPDVPTPGMALGFSPNADFTLATPRPLTSLLSLKNVRGPLACTASVCTDNWKTGTEAVAPLCQLLQASCTADPAGNNLSCTMPPDGGTTGTGGTGGGAGSSGSAGGTGTGGGAGGTSGTGGTGGGGSGGGCKCTLPAPDGRDGLAAVIAALALCFVLRARRRRSGGAA